MLIIIVLKYYYNIILDSLLQRKEHSIYVTGIKNQTLFYLTSFWLLLFLI